MATSSSPDAETRRFWSLWHGLPPELRAAILRDYCPAHAVTAAVLCARASPPVPPPEHHIAVTTSGLDAWPRADALCIVCHRPISSATWILSLVYTARCHLWACLPCVRRRLYHRDDRGMWRSCFSPWRHDRRVVASCEFAILPPPWDPEILPVASVRRWSPRYTHCLPI